MGGGLAWGGGRGSAEEEGEGAEEAVVVQGVEEAAVEGHGCVGGAGASISLQLRAVSEQRISRCNAGVAVAWFPRTPS